MSPTITLLICTSGRAQKLDRCLRAITAGSERPHQLVVVNGEDEKTPAVVESHAGEFPEAILIRHPNRNLATLRNIGIPHCTGDVIAMTDDDAVPDADWIAAIRNAHTAYPDAGGIGGPVRGMGGSLLSRIADTVVFPTPRLGQTIFTLPTVNMSYKRAAITKVGEFDETLFRGEDVDFNWRLIQAGLPILFEPEMKVEHEHRARLWGLYQQQWMYGRAYVRVRRKWPDMYSVYPHTLGSARSWLKLAHSAVAIVYQPWSAARTMDTPADRVRAYAVIAGHHFTWKLGMLRQALSDRVGSPVAAPGRVPETIERWPKPAAQASDLPVP